MGGKSKILAAIDEAADICEGAIMRLEACETILRKVFTEALGTEQADFDLGVGWVDASGIHFTDDERAIIEGLVAS